MAIEIYQTYHACLEISKYSQNKCIYIWDNWTEHKFDYQKKKNYSKKQQKQMWRKGNTSVILVGM